MEGFKVATGAPALCEDARATGLVHPGGGMPLGTPNSPSSDKESSRRQASYSMGLEEK